MANDFDDRPVLVPATGNNRLIVRVVAQQSLECMGCGTKSIQQILSGIVHRDSFRSRALNHLAAVNRGITSRANSSMPAVLGKSSTRTMIYSTPRSINA